MYRSLKYGLFKCPAWISFMVKGRCVPFNTFLWMILSISVSCGKYFWTIFSVLTKSINSGGSTNCDLSGLWYISDIIPSWYGKFSSKSLFISRSKSKSSCLSICITLSGGFGGGLVIGFGYIGSFGSSGLYTCLGIISLFCSVFLLILCFIWGF